MSKPRYNWWPFALNMIRDYPDRKREYNDLHEQKITANLSGIPGGGGSSRTVEDIALRLLPRQEQLEYDAVRRAVELTLLEPEGKLRFDIVDLTIMKNRYTLHGAALRLNVSYRTAQRYRWLFVALVGYTYGFLSLDEYETLKKLDQGGCRNINNNNL